MRPVRLLLVDDSPEFLEFLDRIVRLFPGVEIAGRSNSGEEALRAVPNLNPDLVLMDLAMPGINGLEATRQLKARPAAPRVVILTGYAGDAYREAAAAAGADGFLPKDESATGLQALIASLRPPPV